MTIADHGTHTTWCPVPGGLQVANRGGAFMGFIEKLPGGGFAAFDAHSERIADFAGLAEARAAVESGRRASDQS
ncbi:hypothetical protein QWJ90_08370 [Microbacterium oryzae]|uniref:hypothetical protein n=1 Tax=Microbacterium oryzae TaxID=743009 RepID=UPI0025AFB5F3|nr:hypothetical protein [Microbacterium oryzae]MDN3310943.1 hypothetical protein [Microbacterium oryzae]